MNKADTTRLIGYIVLAYPNADKYKDEEQVRATVSLWARIFADDDPAIVALAVDKHISTSKWPPSVAEIKENMAEITNPDIIPPDIAWAAVADQLYASHGGSLYGGSAQLYRMFPADIARVVESIGWDTLYELNRGSYAGNKDGMDRVAFMDLYKPAYERARQNAMLPRMVRAGIQRAQGRLTDGSLKMLDEAKQRRTEQDVTYDSFDALRKINRTDRYNELARFRGLPEKPPELPEPHEMEDDNT